VLDYVFYIYILYTYIAIYQHNGDVSLQNYRDSAIRSINSEGHSCDLNTTTEEVNDVTSNYNLSTSLSYLAK